MSTYDPFRFMEERQEGKQVTEADCNEFQMFNTCRYLSMAPNMRKYEPDKMIARMQGEERQIKKNLKKAANLK